MLRSIPALSGRTSVYSARRKDLGRSSEMPSITTSSVEPCNWTARSCFSAAFRVENVPRLRRRPVFGFFLREYSRYLPDASLRIMALTLLKNLTL